MKKITRRRFLRGSAAGFSTALALPCLEIMFGSEKAFAQSASRTNFLTFYVPNGTIEAQWFPSSGSGSNFSLVGTALEVFETSGLKNDISLFKGMTSAGRSGSGNAHMRAISGFLTGSALPNDAITQHKISLDQKLANHYQQIDPTPVHSLQLCGNPELDPPNNTRYNNALKNSLSFNSRGDILPNKANLQNAFDRLFKGVDSGDNSLSLEDATKLSVLDSVKDDINRVLAVASENDRIRLEQYFDGVREVELELQRSTTVDTATLCSVPTENFPATSDSARNDRIGNHAKLAGKMLAAAFSCNATRVATYVAGGEAAGCRYSDIGINTHIHNSLSHNVNSSSSAREKYHQIDRYHSEMVASMMTDLKNTIGPTGENLLNNTCVLYGSGLGNGENHSLNNIALMVGGRFGAFQPGRFNTHSGTNHNRLLMALHEEFGLNGNGFGDNTNGNTINIRG